MTRSTTMLALGLVALVVSAVSSGTSVSAGARKGDTDGWQIPATAASETNPVAVNDTVLTKGKQVYRSKCQRCHGPSGVGDGPEADPDHMPGNLTDPSRAARNPDGVMFYKVWNGRSSPKMPAFSTNLSREEVWTLIHYVKTLRK